MAHAQRLSSRTQKIGAIFCLAVALAWAFVFFRSRDQHIVDFNKSPEQTAFLQKVFKDNWYRLVSEESDFELNYMLEHGVSHKDRFMPPHTMKLYKDTTGKYVGFVTYYHPYMYQQGHALLLFLVVDKDERGKGYAKKLMEYALNDLKKQGCSSVELAVRIENKEAQKLYRSFGFYESPEKRDGGFMRMRRLLL